MNLKSKEIVSLKSVILLAGAFCAYMIGSGFSTGQEILQFFAVYGLIGILGILIALSIFIYFGYNLYGIGKKMNFKNPYDVFEYYCGKKVGIFFEWFSVILFYLTYIVMLTGFGAALEQYYGVPVYIGAWIMGILGLITVLMGLERLVNIIGIVGPIIILFTIVIGIASILENPKALFEANVALQKLGAEQEIMKAAPNWFISSVIYPCFAVMTGVPFMASCGASAKSIKEAKISGTVAAIMFCLAILMITISLLININIVVGTQIPTLVIANKLVPIVGLFFSLIILLGIYSTASPLLWSTVRKFAEDGTKKSVILTIVLTLIGVFFGGIIPFNILVNIIYGYAGYLGLIFLGFMIAKQVKVKSSKTKNESL